VRKKRKNGGSPTSSGARARQYREQGYLSPLTIYDAASAEHASFRAGFDALADAEDVRARLASPETRKACDRTLIDRHFDQPWVWALATAPPVLGLVASIIGPDVLCIATHIFVKFGDGERTAAAVDDPPGTPVDWHQDATYWGLDDAEDVLTVWYAIDASNGANGCVQALPHTHTTFAEHGKSTRGGNLLASNQAISVGNEALASKVDFDLRPGQASLHHGMLIHGSRPNASSSRRCGLTLRYAPTRVRQTGEMKAGGTWRALCVRGEDRFGHFPGVVPPAFAASSPSEANDGS
jgi:ectoine hydroxylase-related dioxygenase (phytanoyl-CoA dioxygenase family)